METYLNEWKDRKTRQAWIDEYHAPEREYVGNYSASFLKAIDSYHHVDQRSHEYIRTIVYDADRGACRVINIEEEMFNSPVKCDQHDSNLSCGAC